MKALLLRLTELFPESGKNTLRSWLRNGRVTVDGKVVKDGRVEVDSSQKVELGKRKKFLHDTIPIIYEDQDCVVVDKPVGLLTVATDYDETKTLHHYLKRLYHPKRVYPVHRLDQGTSGVILFALSEEARDFFKELFASHDLDRFYVAIVEGEMDEEKGTWESYLYEDSSYKVYSTRDRRKGKRAVTHYQVLGRHKGFTRLQLRLETGKKNQIRVHCADAGYRVVGDEKYGSQKDPLKRLCLHAEKLIIRHPKTHKKMTFESPLPFSFKRLCR